MKKTILLAVFLVLCWTSAWADSFAELTKGYDFYFFGVNLETFKAKNLNYPAAIAGGITAVLVHTGGHYLVAGLNGVSIKQEGLHEIYDFSKMNDRQCRDIASGGAIAQAIGGLILTSIPATRQSSFTKGYVIVEAVETISHPFVWNGYNDDTGMSINHGGSNWEMVGYDAIASHNLLRVKWYKEEIK
jgi:hypothetical protein